MIIARVMTVTGRPWDELEESLTWPRLRALTDYWNDQPPVHEMLGLVAMAIGAVKPANTKKGNLGDLISMFEGGAVK